MGENRKWPWHRQRPRQEEAALIELEANLRATGVLITQAYAGFNAVVDDELVESYVYEIRALQARYSYLLRQRKALEQSCSAPLPQTVCPVLPVA